MKKMKRFFYLLAYCILALSFTACEKEEDGPDPDVTWDFYPINFYFTLTGENGEDLLSHSTPGTYAGLNITATYEDKTYKVDVFEDNKIPYGRAYFAQLFGIYTTQLNDERYALCFGELDGAHTYKDATLTLNWGDGTTDVVTFSSKLTWKGHDPHITRSFYLNGTQVAKDTAFPVIDIQKTAFDYSQEMVWDIVPLNFNIYLQDKKGYDLLNTSVEGHINPDSVKAIFQGKEYHLNTYLPENRAILPEFTGLTRPWHNQNDTRAYPVYFGELDGTETFENEMLIMDWGTLGRDTITFTSKMNWDKGKPTFVRHYSLNGTEMDKDTPCPIIRVIKK